MFVDKGKEKSHPKHKRMFAQVANNATKPQSLELAGIAVKQ
jgi:hypothetical protein